jgi:hypothetical protein
MRALLNTALEFPASGRDRAPSNCAALVAKSTAGFR